MTTESNSGNDIAGTLGLHKGAGTGRGRKTVITIAIALIAGIAAYYLFFGSPEKSGAPRYSTQEARKGDLTVTVVATGTLKPVNQVDVGSEISGTVRTVEANFNDKVRAGQVLARLYTDRLRAQVMQSEAALMSAEAGVLEAKASLTEATNRYERVRRLWEGSGGTSPSESEVEAALAEFERAQAREASAKAKVAEAKAVLEANRTNLDKAEVRAPIDGVVLQRNIEPGQTVAASLQAPVLFTLAEDLRNMELHVDVDEAEVGLIREGQHSSFTVDAYPDRAFGAKITMVKLGSKTLEGVVTYETVLAVDNADLSLRPGMTATAEITVRKIINALLVSNAALRFTPPAKEAVSEPGNTSFISKMFPRTRRGSANGRGKAPDKHNMLWSLSGGVLAPIPIETGATDGTMTEVLEGELAPGAKLVVGMEGSER